MLATIMIGALSAAALIPQTDTTIALNGATRLELENLRGEVVVRTWDRNEVRIVADHSDSRFIDLHRRGSTLEVEVEVERGLGLAGGVDFQLTVPRGLDLDIEGMALEVDIQDTEGKVEVTTIHGGIRVRGGRGTITLESVNGEILVEGAQGRLQINGVAGGVTLRDCSGDIRAESVGGSLVLEGITSRDVEAGTVGGTVSYSGSILDGGSYNFGSHAGDIRLYLPTGINARVDVVTLSGDIHVDYPGAPGEPTRRRGIPGLNEKELSFELGTGRARVEVETFGGTVHILRQGGEG